MAKEFTLPPDLYHLNGDSHQISADTDVRMWFLGGELSPADSALYESAKAYKNAQPGTDPSAAAAMKPDEAPADAVDAANHSGAVAQQPVIDSQQPATDAPKDSRTVPDGDFQPDGALSRGGDLTVNGDVKSGAAGDEALAQQGDGPVDTDPFIEAQSTDAEDAYEQGGSAEDAPVESITDSLADATAEDEYMGAADEIPAGDDERAGAADDIPKEDEDIATTPDDNDEADAPSEVRDDSLGYAVGAPTDDGDVASFDALDGAFNLGAQAAPADEPQVIDPAMSSFDTTFDIDFAQGGAQDPLAAQSAGADHWDSHIADGGYVHSEQEIDGPTVPMLEAAPLSDSG